MTLSQTIVPTINDNLDFGRFTDCMHIYLYISYSFIENI